MAKQSAGVLLYRRRDGQLSVFLIHPGGPLWAKKDLGAWSIPKGELDANEDMLAAARREFHEETGQIIDGDFHALPPCRQKGGKIVHAFAIEGDADEAVVSNNFEMEWPPKSGRRQSFPEVDRAAWFTIDKAFERILPSQQPLLSALRDLLT